MKQSNCQQYCLQHRKESFLYLYCRLWNIWLIQRRQYHTTNSYWENKMFFFPRPPFHTKLKLFIIFIPWKYRIFFIHSISVSFATVYCMLTMTWPQKSIDVLNPWIIVKCSLFRFVGEIFYGFKTKYLHFNAESHALALWAKP